MYANLSLWFVRIKADSDLVYSKGVKLQEKGAILQFPNPTGEKENIAHKKTRGWEKAHGQIDGATSDEENWRREAPSPVLTSTTADELTATTIIINNKCWGRTLHLRSVATSAWSLQQCI